MANPPPQKQVKKVLANFGRGLGHSVEFLEALQTLQDIIYKQGKRLESMVISGKTWEFREGHEDEIEVINGVLYLNLPE